MALSAALPPKKGMRPTTSLMPLRKIPFARRRHEMKSNPVPVASGGPHCLARHFGAGAAGAAALGQAGDADAQLGVGEGEQGDEAALAADEAFRGDDPGETGVPDQGYARQFFADALKDSIHVVVGAGVNERHLDAAQPDLAWPPLPARRGRNRRWC